MYRFFIVLFSLFLCFYTEAAKFFPPTELHFKQERNNFLARSDFFNVLTWSAPKRGEPPAGYAVYRDEALSKPLAFIPANAPLVFKERTPKKDKYFSCYIVSVYQDKSESSPIGLVLESGRLSWKMPLPPTHTLKLLPEYANLVLNTQVACELVAELEGGKRLDVTQKALWTSSDEEVATVTSQGLVCAVGCGSALITASYDGCQVVRTFRVAPILTSVTLSPSSPLTHVGGVVFFHPTAHFSDGTEEDFSSPIKWTSSNPAVATVDPEGMALGLEPGETLITVETSKGVTGATQLTVE